MICKYDVRRRAWDPLRRTTVKLLLMSRNEGGFRMVPVAVGVDFGTSNSVVAIADRSGQVGSAGSTRRSGSSRPIVRRCSSSARAGRRTQRWVIYPGLTRSCARRTSTPNTGFCNLSKRTCRAPRWRTLICSAGVSARRADWRPSQRYSSCRHKRSLGCLQPSGGFRGRAAKRSSGHLAERRCGACRFRV